MLSVKKEVNIEVKETIRQHQTIDLPQNIEPLVIIGDVIEKLKKDFQNTTAYLQNNFLKP